MGSKYLKCSKYEHKSNRSSEAYDISARPADSRTSIREIGGVQPPVLLLGLLYVPSLIINRTFDISG